MRTRLVALVAAVVLATTGCHIHFTEVDADIRLCAWAGRELVGDGAIATWAELHGDDSTSNGPYAKCNWYVEDHGHFHRGKVEFETHRLWEHSVGTW
jgi:hypothetical protein